MKRFLILVLAIFVTSYNVFAEQSKFWVYIDQSFWQEFNDEKLMENIDTLSRQNNDLKAVTLKVSEAQRLVKISFANELPHIGFDGSINQIFRGSDQLFGDIKIPDYTETRFLMPFTMNYEIDIWGKNHLKTKSQKKKLEMMKQDEKATYIYVVSFFAADYYNLIKTDELIRLQRELIATQNNIVKSMENKYEMGTATAKDVLVEKQCLTDLEEELNNLLEKQDVLKNQLNVILGDRVFTDIKRLKYSEINPKIVIPESVNADVLAKRPDWVKSEIDLQRMGIDVKVAKREFLPTFNLFGNIGFNAYNLSSSHTFLANIGVAPSLDIFMGGKKIQMLKLRKDEYKVGLEHYNKTILTSLQETNDSLYTLKCTDKKKELSDKRLEIAKARFVMTNEQYNDGISDKIDLLAHKEIELLAQKQNVSLKINEIIALINLYNALGGFNIYKLENI